nr:MAG TPA: hypothetical protein [Caudoviricetes sp.]
MPRNRDRLLSGRFLTGIKKILVKNRPEYLPVNF